MVEALELINQAGQRQWQAAAWKLERLFPQHFSLQQRELQKALKQLAELEAKLAELQSQNGNKPVLKTAG